MSSTRLPGGRGPRITDDAIPAQEEQYQSRGTRVPVKKPYYFATISDASKSLEVFNFTPAILNVFQLFPVDFDGVIDNVRYAAVEMQIGPTPPVGPKRAEFALYRLSVGRVVEFIQLPQTYFEANAVTTTGTVPAGKNPRPIAALPDRSNNISFSGTDQELFLGYRVKDEDTSLVGVIPDSSGGLAMPFYERALLATEEMPRRLLLSSTFVNEDAQLMLPYVRYATAFGAQLLGWQT